MNFSREFTVDQMFDLVSILTETKCRLEREIERTESAALKAVYSRQAEQAQALLDVMIPSRTTMQTSA